MDIKERTELLLGHSVEEHLRNIPICDAEDSRLVPDMNIEILLPDRFKKDITDKLTPFTDILIKNNCVHGLLYYKKYDKRDLEKLEKIGLTLDNSIISGSIFFTTDKEKIPLAMLALEHESSYVLIS
jgi:hypothetical protein